MARKPSGMAVAWAAPGTSCSFAGTSSLARVLARLPESLG
jgi:hypothetical protein